MAGLPMQVAERPSSEEQGHNTILLAPPDLEQLGFTGAGVLIINGTAVYSARAHAKVPRGCVALDSMQCNSVDAFVGETVEVLRQLLLSCCPTATPGSSLGPLTSPSSQWTVPRMSGMESAHPPEQRY